MKFDEARLYSIINADGLKPGDKVIVADTLAELKDRLSRGFEGEIITGILDEEWCIRFEIGDHNYALAYLIERAENCTNCANRGNSYCSCFTRNKSDDELSRTVCDNYIRLSEQKSEKKCGNCRHKDRTDGYCPPSCQSNKDVCNKWETELNYRPFKDVDELVKVWCEKGGKWQKRELTMPLIWVKRKKYPKDRGTLITSLDEDIVYIGICQRTMDELFDEYTFFDGSVCGVEE